MALYYDVRYNEEIVRVPLVNLSIKSKPLVGLKQIITLFVKHNCVNINMQHSRNYNFVSLV